jgi:ABC-type Na+ efflux pump permease subunit
MQSDDLADLIEASLVPDEASARLAVDNQQAQVAVIIPADFSRQFADPYGLAAVEFYQDPTLTIGPGIVKSIMSRFMDTMSGIKIALDVALEQTESSDYAIVGQVIQQYLDTSSTQTEDLTNALLDVRSPVKTTQAEENPVLRFIGPLMGAFMIFYAFYTGTSSAESILREEEERTLPRLFTTPTPQATILTGKFLAVLLTVSVQVAVLLIAAHLIFGIQWGAFFSVALPAVGIVPPGRAG